MVGRPGNTDRRPERGQLAAIIWVSSLDRQCDGKTDERTDGQSAMRNVPFIGRDIQLGVDVAAVSSADNAMDHASGYYHVSNQSINQWSID